MVERIKKPVVLFMPEGFGLSSLWQGNSILSAGSLSFSKYWQKYYHLPLSVSDSVDHSLLASNPVSAYQAIFYGHDVPSISQKITSDISEKNNQTMKSFLSSAVNHDSALHLIGTLSENEGNLDYLEMILKACNVQKLYRVYLHLALDQTLSNVSSGSLFRKFSELLSKFSNVELASVFGLRVVFANQIDRIYSSLISGKGELALDFQQLISYSDGKFFDTPFTALTKNKDAWIKSFDSVIFFDSSYDQYLPLINQLVSTAKGAFAGFSVQRPKFINVATLISSPETDQLVPSLFGSPNIDQQNIFSALIKKGVSIAGCFEADQDAVLRFYLGKTISFSKQTSIISEVGANYLKSWKNSLNKLIGSVESLASSDKYDLIFATTPLLPKIVRYGSFSECVSAVSELDHALARLKEIVIQKDGTLIFSSPFGMAEKIERIQIGSHYLAKPTLNPVPLLIIAKNSQISEKNFTGNNLLNDLIGPKKKISFLHQLLSLIFFENDDTKVNQP